MRAAWFDHFGSAKDVLEIGDIDAPVAASGEVLVRLRTSGINPSDVKKRAGSFANLLDGGFVIPNSDGAGIIEAVGDGVDANRIGERVWVYQAQYARRFGTAAEYVAIDARRAPSLPDNVSFEVGACLGIPAMTAHRAVFADGPVAGQDSAGYRWRRPGWSLCHSMGEPGRCDGHRDSQQCRGCGCLQKGRCQTCC